MKTRHYFILLFILLPLLLLGSCDADAERDNPNDPQDSDYEKFYVWRTKAAMPGGARAQLASAAVNGKVYVLGGTSTGSNTLDRVEQYNPKTNTWTTKLAMPTARRAFAVAVVGNSIYAIGGEGNLDSIEAYDVTNSTWDTSLTDMLTGRRSLVAAVVNNKIYAIGGVKSGTVLTTVEEYNPDDNSWKTDINNSGTLIPISPARMDMTASVVNNIIYIIGGSSNSSNVVSTVQAFDPSANGGTGAWVTKKSMSTARKYHSAVVMNNKIYIIGGHDGSQAINSVEIYNPATNSWSSDDSILTANYAMTAAYVNKKIIVSGGYDGDFLNTVEAYEPYYTD